MCDSRSGCREWVNEKNPKEKDESLAARDRDAKKGGEVGRNMLPDSQ